MQPKLNNNSVVLARESRGISQTNLAEKLGIAQAVLSRIEHGTKTDISQVTLKKLSEELNYPESFFFLPGQIVPMSSAFQYRKGSMLKALDQKRIEANANITRIHVNRLLQDVELETSFKTYHLDEFEGISDIARAVRFDWKLPRGPITNLSKVVEAVGIIIISMDFGTRYVSGFSLYHGEKYPLLFINNNMPTDRCRFTIAHELAHILMHQTWTNSMEEEANEFASEFLMPGYDIKDDLFDLTLSRLANLKEYWKSSMLAIAMRAKKLNKIDAEKYKYICMKMSSAGYRLREPIDIPKEPPHLLNEIIDLYFNKLSYTVDDLSNILCLCTDEFRTKYVNQNHLRILQ